jgi:hypothetical protein
MAALLSPDPASLSAGLRGEQALPALPINLRCASLAAIAIQGEDARAIAAIARQARTQG